MNFQPIIISISAIFFTYSANTVLRTIPDIIHANSVSRIYLHPPATIPTEPSSIEIKITLMHSTPDSNTPIISENPDTDFISITYPKNTILTFPMKIKSAMLNMFSNPSDSKQAEKVAFEINSYIELELDMRKIVRPNTPTAKIPLPSYHSEAHSIIVLIPIDNEKDGLKIPICYNENFKNKVGYNANLEIYICEKNEINQPKYDKIKKLDGMSDEKIKGIYNFLKTGLLNYEKTNGELPIVINKPTNDENGNDSNIDGKINNEGNEGNETDEEKDGKWYESNAFIITVCTVGIVVVIGGVVTGFLVMENNKQYKEAK